MLLQDLLERAAAAHGDQPAAIDSRRTATYSDVDREANRVAHLLRSNGVGRGDRVLLALENSIAFIACYFGILKAEAVVVPMAPGPQNDRLEAAVADCTPAAAIVDRPTFEILRSKGVAGRLRATFVTSSNGPAGDGAAMDIETAVAGCPDSRPSSSAIDIDLAAIIYTSGSTGAPRGVMLSHLNFVANARSIVGYLRLEPNDRVMAVLPFHYVYGLSLLHTHVMVGGTVVIENGFLFPNLVLKKMAHHEVTGFAGVPSSFAILLRRSAIATTVLPHLRYVTQAGGPMPPALVREWRAVMPAVPLVVMYGATEAAARLTYLDPAELDARVGSVGRPIPNVEIAILRDDGRRAAPGEVGELVARGSNISTGYWNSPVETGERFTALGYHTGDLGYADADGFIYLVARKHDMLKVGAHRVGVREIEDVVYEHPDVHEAAIVGIEHALLGEAPAAFVAPRDASTLTPDEIIRFCRGRLPEHKVPVRVTIVRELPKNASGKIDRLALRDEAGRQAAAV
jgi:long-chain acyl-CoA synthetase